MERSREFIEEFIKDIISHIFMKDMDLTRDTDPLLFIKQSPEAADFYRKLMGFAVEGKINEGENFLFDESEDKKSPELLIPGIVFYRRINDMDDEVLSEHCFSRREVLEGLRDFLKVYGYGVISAQYLERDYL